MATVEDKTIGPVRPNEGIRIAYQTALDDLIKEMNDSVSYWLHASYKANEPMAMDASPASALQAAIKLLAARWQKKFDDASSSMAAHFAKSTADQTDASLRSALKKSGFAIKFTMTKPIREALQATTFENVGLIKSIPSEHFAQIEGLVMRSLNEGRNLQFLTDQLQSRFKLTRNRAKLISRDQSNKATAIINKVRQEEIGIVEAKWLHSHGGRHPRPSHVAADGKIYKIAEGMLIDGKRIWPGTEINCRCVSRSIIPGLRA